MIFKKGTGIYLRSPSMPLDYAKTTCVDLGNYKRLSKNHNKFYNLVQSVSTNFTSGTVLSGL